MKLSRAARARLPSRLFGLPKERKFPIEDAKHRALAKGRAVQGLKRGTLTRRQYLEVMRRASK